MTNILNSTDLDQIINILIDHIENIPNFFDECKTEERKNEIRKEIREKTIKIAKEYFNKKEEQKNVEEVHKEEKQNLNNLEELEKKKNELIEMMEKEKKKREIEKKNMKNTKNLN